MEKKFRLRAGVDFQKVRKEGLSWAHPLMVLCTFPNSLGHNRFGFSVSRRIGSAVVRNRAKRRIREAVRLCEGVEQGWDMVFIARAPLPDARFDSIRQAVEALLRRADLLRSAGDSVYPGSEN